MTGTRVRASPPTGAHRLLPERARGTMSLAAHHDRHGPLPSADGLIAAIEAAGLRGRGGAGFPTARKLRAVGSGRRARVVVANGCEGEPVSRKDHVLLTYAPHLVLDGLRLVGEAIGADRLMLCVHRGDPVARAVAAALRERAEQAAVDIVEVPDRYVASEESAIVRFLNTGDARPTTKPPRPSDRGVRGRPTLIDNVETLAHIALIARYGPDWFRGHGTHDSPGTALFTVSGAVGRPSVHELPLGVPIGGVLAAAGGPVEHSQAVLVGGYAGTWLPLPFAAEQRMAHETLRGIGAAFGVGALVLLPTRSCGLAETARMLRYLAQESAVQCGPCMFGLPAIAEDFDALVLGGRAADDALGRLRRRLPVITGRGACGHPDGAVRLAASALRAFDRDLRAHITGRPCPGAGHPLLPVPRSTGAFGRSRHGHNA